MSGYLAMEVHLTLLQETHFDPTAGINRTCFDEWPLPDDTTNQFWITVYPYGPLTLTGDTVICVGETANFTAVSQYGEYKAFDFNYNNGTPVTTQADSVGTTIFSEPKHYNITVKGVTKEGCTQYDTLKIRVEDVQAKIVVDSSRANLAIFTFLNDSKILNGNGAANEMQYIWNYGDGSPEVVTNNITPVVHEYKNFPGEVPEGDEGETPIKSYKVTLTTISKIGCEKVDSVIVEIPRKWKRYNVLTPNDDLSNDVFNPKIGGEVEYDLTIFNRWGEKVFESQDSKVDWNGKVNNTGADSPEGTYYYIWKFKLVGGFEKTVNGTVTVLR